MEQAAPRGAVGKGSCEHREAELLPTNITSCLQPKPAVVALGPEELAAGLPCRDGHVPGGICCP